MSTLRPSDPDPGGLPPGTAHVHRLVDITWTSPRAVSGQEAALSVTMDLETWSVAQTSSGHNDHFDLVIGKAPAV